MLQTKIKSYDGKYVSFEYVDHYDNKPKLKRFTIDKFISRLIAHIPDKEIATAIRRLDIKETSKNRDEQLDLQPFAGVHRASNTKSNLYIYY